MRIFKAAVFVLLAELFFNVGLAFANDDVKNGVLSPERLEIGRVDFAADPYSKAAYEPFIKMNVFNNSAEAITKAIIVIEAEADGGKMKLFKDKIVVSIDGALKAYETDVWVLYPGPSSELALKGLPPDTRIKAHAEKVLCKKRNSPWFYEHKFSRKRSVYSNLF